MGFIRDRLDEVERKAVGLILDPDNGREHPQSVRLFLAWLTHLSCLFHGVVQTRNFMYRKGLFRHHALGCQVISIGNLTVGGTGKTPVVEVFARELQKAGRRVAILSRGYKKAAPSFPRRVVDGLTLAESRRPPRVVSDGKALLLNSAMSGDEPYMLASNLPDVCVLVDKNRVKSGRYAIDRLGCDTLILDDGYQYLFLKHWVEIALVDSTNPFGNGHMLPRGILREPTSNIAKADYIFITKCGKKGDGAALSRQLSELNPKAEIIECQHCARYLQNVASGQREELTFLEGLKVSVVSGIASPGGFEKELRTRGAEIVDNHRFADHHRYSQQEIIDIINAARTKGADAIITTEKDAVRFPRLSRVDIPIYFLRVDIEILSGEEDFHACIARICFEEDDGS